MLDRHVYVNKHSSSVIGFLLVNFILNCHILICSIIVWFKNAIA